MRAGAGDVGTQAHRTIAGIARPLLGLSHERLADSLPTALFIDKSGSMEIAIELGKRIGSLISAICEKELYVYAFDTMAYPIERGGDDLASWEKALKGIGTVDTVIEGHGDVNTWSGFRDYAQFNRALLDAARAGMGKRSADQIAADLIPKFPVFTKEELLTDMEYGGTPLSRAVINVNIAFQELGKK